MSVALVLFTRDLRVRDQPALAAAVREHERVIGAFVLDEILLAGAAPNRLAFLLDSLRDLDGALRERGACLVVRRGRWVEQALHLARQAGAEAIYTSADVSAYAHARTRRLARECERERIALRVFDGVTALPPGGVAPTGGDHYRVFTPYWRAWSEALGIADGSPQGSRRAAAPGAGPTPHRGAPSRRVAASHRVSAPPRVSAPRRLSMPADVPDGARLLASGDLGGGRAAAGWRRACSPDLPRGGETAGRARLADWLRQGLGDYERLHDDLAADATSRLSPYLHFGCLSVGEVLCRVEGREGGAAFARQLCWRDFYHQVVAARPDFPHADYRPRAVRWSASRRLLEAWREGRTGYPIVDAGMRQLAREGFMHNRARLITASFLTKLARVDWRRGAAHYWDLLVDGDLANNSGNWQWVAGTGNDTRPNRVLNPLRQARRFDPEGEYVRRYVAELAEVGSGAVHEPWKLPPARRRVLRYPAPVIDAGASARTLRLTSAR